MDIVDDCTLVAVTLAAAIAGAAAADTIEFLQLSTVPSFTATTNDALGTIANFMWCSEFESAIGRNYQNPYWLLNGFRLPMKTGERIYVHGMYSGTVALTTVGVWTLYFV